MIVRLPYGLHRTYLTVLVNLWQERLRLARHGRADGPPIDRRLLARMADAIEAGLPSIEPCPLEAYDGPHAEVVQRVERERPRARFPVTTRRGDQLHTVQSLGGEIVHEVADAHPEALALRWLLVGVNVPFRDFTACADHFELIVRADTSAIVWHVAASLYTWVHADVRIEQTVADTLRRWCATMPELDPWCRAQQDAGDPYVRFMAAYATRLLDGLAERDDASVLERYCKLAR
jgi:hypothetical protein